MDRLVTHVRRDHAGRPVALCNPAEAWSPRGAVDAIAGIETDVDADKEHYVVEANGSRAEVVVVVVVEPSGARRKWLRTSPDATADNNLSSLPEYVGDSGGTSTEGAAPVRRNIATVGKDERDRLRDAILELDKRYYDRDSAISKWHKQHAIHGRTHVHGGPAFLTWHRHLTNRFEGLLQEIDPGLALHYWDWRTDPRRTPDGRGGFVNLFQDEFMGSSNGPLLRPFLNLSGLGITRALRAGTPQDYSSKIGSDQDAIWDDTFSTMRKKLEIAHNWVHGYFGGTILDVHDAFKDPFVFLIHSNVDRLYASWQVRARGDHRRALERLDPSRVYGAERDSVDGLVPDLDPNAGPGSMVWGSGLSSPLAPWDGSGGFDGAIEPWRSLPESITSVNPAVVRPPLYDRYVFPPGCSWNALLVGQPLPNGDIIQATITPGAAPADEVRFDLETGPDVQWWKGLRVPDGEGSSWLIQTDGTQRHDSVSLWAHQVHQGQELIFYKAVGLGAVKRIVYRLGDLGRLAPGSRVTFKWWDDNWSPLSG